MKKMKTTIAVALAACVSTQVFAQVKEDVITFSLTGQAQNSVSTSATVANAGTWSAGPRYYKTATTKVTDQDIIKFIGAVKHRNPAYYSTKAKLVMVQGELSGFFNITPELGNSIPQNETYALSPYYLDGIIDDGTGNGFTADPDAQTDIPNSTDSAFVTLANGHHMLINNTDPVDFTGNDLYPVGHNQPWGQIFIKDVANAHTDSTVASPLCENVTYYFAFSVEECYDCFYLNSFVSDTAFVVSTPKQTGPPCCGAVSTLLGKGKDRYYLTLSFDNTQNNPYLNESSDFWVGNYITSTEPEVGYGPVGLVGPIPGDGLTPDVVNVPQPANNNAGHQYLDTIRRTPPFANIIYEARFTLNGIFTYTWNLKYVNTSDASPDFVGVGSYAASGYGFVSLYCTLFTGSATFNETVVKTACCLDNGPWSDTYGGWYGPGAEYYDTFDDSTSSYITDSTKYSLGKYDSAPGDLTPTGLAGPINTGVSLTYHHNFDLNYGWAQNTWGAGWPTPAIIEPNGMTPYLPLITGWADFSIGQPAGYQDYAP
jgi:hypothetical protein